MKNADEKPSPEIAAKPQVPEAKPQEVKPMVPEAKT
jgi:hypothetical protein